MTHNLELTSDELLALRNALVICRDAFFDDWESGYLKGKQLKEYETWLDLKWRIGQMQ